MRRALDLLYRISGALAAAFLFSIAVLVVVQMSSRLFRVVVPGADDFASYCLVAASFLGLAPTLRAGVHIRVTLLLQRLGARKAWLFEVFSIVMSMILTGYFAYWSVDFVVDSYFRGDVGHAMMATPLWIPRIGMAVGVVVLFIAFVDELVHVLRGGVPRYEPPSRRITH
jgi:TRAP-type C4-dicarboxylate transport system permease small subunit